MTTAAHRDSRPPKSPDLHPSRPLSSWEFLFSRFSKPLKGLMPIRGRCETACSAGGYHKHANNGCRTAKAQKKKLAPEQETLHLRRSSNHAPPTSRLRKGRDASSQLSCSNYSQFLHTGCTTNASSSGFLLVLFCCRVIY